jgi:hypothetical protein
VIRLLITLALACALPAAASAALVFDSPQAEASPTLSDAEVVSHFRFTNAGAAPVKLVSVKASCSCTTAQLAKSDYQPGESGEITATFAIGDRVGEQRKTISVLTDDPGAPTYALLMIVHLPSQAQISPRVLVWRLGDDPAARTVDIVIPDGVTQTIDRATPSGHEAADFRCELTTVTAGRRYRLTVAPIDTAITRSTVIELAAGAKTYRVYARVRPPVAAPKAATP